MPFSPQKSPRALPGNLHRQVCLAALGHDAANMTPVHLACSTGAGILNLHPPSLLSCCVVSRHWDLGQSLLSCAKGREVPLDPLPYKDPGSWYGVRTCFVACDVQEGGRVDPFVLSISEPGACCCMRLDLLTPSGLFLCHILSSTCTSMTLLLLQASMWKQCRSYTKEGTGELVCIVSSYCMFVPRLVSQPRPI